MTKPKVVRNEKLFAAFKQASVPEVAKSFGVSTRRIYELVTAIKANDTAFKPNLSLRAWHVLLRAGIQNEQQLIELARVASLHDIAGCGWIVYHELKAYRAELIRNRANEAETKAKGRSPR